MKEKIQKLKEKEWLCYLVLILTTVLVSYPMFRLQIRGTHDGFLHLLRLIGTNEAIVDGKFPFLIAPYYCRNFGYAMNVFYPQIVTYIPLLFKLITNHYYDALKLYAVFTMLLSGIFMYRFVKEMTNNKAISLIAGIIYIVAPYKLEDVYTRFAIGEFTAFVFMPIVFQGLYNMINGDGKKHYYIAIGATGLLLCHSISTIYTALFCLIYCIFYWRKILKAKNIKRCILNIILILLMTACFTVPMLEHKLATDYTIMIPEIMGTDSNRASNCTIEFWQFLKDKGEENGVSFIIGVPIIIGVLITVFTFKKINKKQKEWYVIFTLFSLISIIMCTKLFPWKIAPLFLTLIQFPWRMMAFAIFFITPVCAVNFYYFSLLLKNKKLQIVCYGLIIAMILGFTILKLETFKRKENMNDFDYESYVLQEKKISHWQVNRDYLPYKAFKVQTTYLNEREDRVYVLKGQANITEEQKQAFNMSFNFENASKDTILELPYLFYFGYDINLKSETGDVISLKEEESEYGFIQFKIPENIQNGTIEVEYTGTILEKVSYAVSIITILGFITVCIYKNKSGH